MKLLDRLKEFVSRIRRRFIPKKKIEPVAAQPRVRLVGSRKGEVRRVKRFLAAKARVMPIYRRGAELFPDEYLVCHQEAEPERTAKIKAQAEERRQRRAKVRVLEPRAQLRTETPARDDRKYGRFPSGQIVGLPVSMREAKQAARQNRLQRRAEFRLANAA